MTHRRTRPVSLYVLMAALLLQGMSGVVGGMGLVTDPTGHAVGTLLIILIRVVDVRGFPEFRNERIMVERTGVVVFIVCRRRGQQ